MRVLRVAEELAPGIVRTERANKIPRASPAATRGERVESGVLHFPGMIRVHRRSSVAKTPGPAEHCGLLNAECGSMPGGGRPHRRPSAAHSMLLVALSFERRESTGMSFPWD